MIMQKYEIFTAMGVSQHSRKDFGKEEFLYIVPIRPPFGGFPAHILILFSMHGMFAAAPFHAHKKSLFVKLT